MSVPPSELTAPPRKRIVVLGDATAGFLRPLSLKKHLPEYPLTVVRSSKMGVIGVG